MAAESENASVTLSRSPKPGKKYFSLSEANRSLAYVARIMDDVTSCYEQVVHCRQRMDSAGENRDAEVEYESAMDRLSEYVDELHQVGVELKDFEKGLLDFPAIHNGREIYLCWHRGEKSVVTWHEIDAGYAGRQDVTLLRN